MYPALTDADVAAVVRRRQRVHAAGRLRAAGFIGSHLAEALPTDAHEMFND